MLAFPSPLEPPARAWGVFLALVLSVLLSVLDYVVGYEISLSFFYLIPIFLVAWTGRRPWVWGMAIFDALLWQGSNYLAGEFHGQAWIYAWDALSRLGFLLVTGLLLHRIRSLLKFEMDTSRTDPLTGLTNRRGLLEMFDWELKRFARRPFSVAVISVDLDHFKQLNDSAGHAEGDRLLVEFARVGRTVLRPSDTFARLGGDEFLIVVVRAERKTVLEIAQRLQGSVETAFAAQGWSVGLSQGVCFQGHGTPNLDDLVARSDRQLYRAKHEGRARICVEEAGESPRP